ncbi:3-isopropylmalate dehydratase small subunit [Bosea sp. BK604]|uniref:3-isopropylmalate dehydratase small subunit n=1 Tax=Bosea sp. BK604 TaxID=2512180 RepID=UPI0010457AE8|nr:3-isopropylmalate dehydratase small subunit [Bosea sp. BK604]TCR67546.1 3-isopropylmalate/(R)-2-methylmalate dehydratase small subunit [Bosea sp. BK604]
MRKPVREISGVMAVMPVANVNTDAIIPSVWLRTATADMGKGLFGGQRYDDEGNEKPDFVLNRPPFRETKILLADENFGCGSSREAAVWALVEFGIGCVLAPSFADIFYENAFRNSLVAGVIDQATYQALKATVEAHEGSPDFRIDLASASVVTPAGEVHGFRIPASRVEALMRGDDEIAMTLQHQPAIEAHYAAAKAGSDWLFPATLQRSAGS